MRYKRNPKILHQSIFFFAFVCWNFFFKQQQTWHANMNLSCFFRKKCKFQWNFIRFFCLNSFNIQNKKSDNGADSKSWFFCLMIMMMMVNAHTVPYAHIYIVLLGLRFHLASLSKGESSIYMRIKIRRCAMYILVSLALELVDISLWRV